MAKLHNRILVAIRKDDHHTMTEALFHLLNAKATQRIAEEKEQVATTLMDPRIAEDAWSDFANNYGSNGGLLQVGDRIRTKRGGQIPGIVTKISNGNVHFAMDNPGGWTKTKTMVTPMSNVIKEDAPKPKPLPKHAANHNRDENDEPICQNCDKPGSKCDCEPHGSFGESFDKDYPNRKDQRAPYYKSGEKVDRTNRPGGDPDSWDAQNRQHGTRKRELSASDKEKNENVNEDTVSQHEVQRVYDEIGDVGETELLCGISDLHVNGHGQVISYICEARSLEQGIGTSPENGIWLKGKHPLDHPGLNQFGRPKPEPNKYCWQCQKPIRNLSRCPFCSEKQ